MAQIDSKYQKRLSLSLAVGVCACSAYCMNIKFLFNSDPKISSFSNHFEMIDEFGDRTGPFKSLVLAGIPFGLVTFGFLSDMFGRLAIVKYQLLIQVFCLIYSLIAFTTNILVVTNFFSGFVFQSIVATSFVLVYESCGQSLGVYTSFIVAAGGLGRAFGSIFFYYAVYWRGFLVACLILCLVSLALLENLHESPEFIVIKRKIGEGVKLVKDRRRENGLFEFESEVDAGKGFKLYSWSLLEVFRRNFSIVAGFLLISFNSVAVYSVLNLLGNKTIENEYLDGIISGLIEVFAIVLVNLYGNLFDIYQIFTGCIFVSRVLMIFIWVLSEFQPATFLMIYIIKAVNYIEIYLIYLLIVKAFPSDIRCKVFGFFKVFGCIGGYYFTSILCIMVEGFYLINLILSVFTFSSFISLSLINFRIK